MFRIFISLLIFVSCTDKKNEASPSEPVKVAEAPEAPAAPIPKDIEPAEPWVHLPEVTGMELSYKKASREGNNFLVSGLDLIEASASYPIYHFPEDVWGKLLLKIRDKEFDVVFSDENKDFQVTYHSPTKESIQTKSLCKWKGARQPTEVKEMSITSMDSTVFKKIVTAAEGGDKRAFDAIMATEATEKTPKEFVAAQTRLKYMKDHGCIWK